MRQLHWLSVKLAIDCLQLVRVQRVCSARAREREKANKEIRIKGILSAHAGHLPLSLNSVPSAMPPCLGIQARILDLRLG